MNTFLLVTALVIIVLLIFYLSGPEFPEPNLNCELPSIQLETSEVEAYIKNKESHLKIKSDNESRIIWASESQKIKTRYSLLFLHGFSASWYSGNPVHIDFARRYGMNLYIPLLASHGIDTTDALIDMTPDCLFDSAKEALVIAHKLGEKVILMGTSTGGTLALKLVAEFPELTEGLILYSPNLASNNRAAFLLSKPWGLQIARIILNGKYYVAMTEFDSEYDQYWNGKFRIEAFVHIQQLLEAIVKKEIFTKIEKPVFLGYYYKDTRYQDPIVRVDAMLKMFDQLGTPENLKQKVAFPEAGCHQIASKLHSGAWKELEQASFDFAEEKLGLKPEKE